MTEKTASLISPDLYQLIIYRKSQYKKTFLSDNLIFLGTWQMQRDEIGTVQFATTHIWRRDNRGGGGGGGRGR